MVIDPSNIMKKEKPHPEHLPLEALNITSDKVEVFELAEKDDQKRLAPKSKKKKKRRPLSKRIRRGWKRLRKAVSRRQSRLELWLDQSKFGIALNAIFHRLRKTFGIRHFNRQEQSAAFQPIFDRTLLLHRMTEMRRLVTGLTRLLGAKHQVVTRLRKRAGTGGGEVAVYISDVQGRLCGSVLSVLF